MPFLNLCQCMPLVHVVVLHSEINIMALKKTIGLIGDQHEWVKRLSREYRLLLFPAGLEPEELYRKEAIPDHSAEDILFVDCVKEGCWEADAVLIDRKSVAPQLLDRIEEVVTQKVVLVIGDRERESGTSLAVAAAISYSCGNTIVAVVPTPSVDSIRSCPP